MQSCQMFVCAQVITKQDERGHKLEPYEDAIIEVPEEHMGQVPAAPQRRRPCRLTDALRPICLITLALILGCVCPMYDIICNSYEASS